MENNMVRVMKVGKGVCVFNTTSGESAYTTKDGLLLIDETGAQMPIREEHLVKNFVNRDGTKLSPSKFTFGRVYNLKRNMMVSPAS